MEFGLPTFALGYAAGVLSTLSPCVLPLVPILIVSALAQHRRGPLALAAGLALSFAVVGLLIATVGVALGLDAGLLRQIAALLLVGFGIALLSTKLQERFAVLTSGVSSTGHGLLARISAGGLRGQFLVGLLLGIVWSPCVGPTLGAASTLAAQGSQLQQVALLMLLFGIGAGTPLVVLGAASREVALRWRGRMLAAGRTGKWLLGSVMIVLGLAIFSGLDKRFEAWAVDVSPAWLTDLTTRY
ncbi:MAG: cytochrome c biogenesis CcdA family protein [Burkholderiaceae bacterium]